MGEVAPKNEGITWVPMVVPLVPNTFNDFRDSEMTTCLAHTVGCISSRLVGHLHASQGV